MLFFFFLIIELCFLIPAVTAQIFNPIAELVIPMEYQLHKKKNKLKYIQ